MAIPFNPDKHYLDTVHPCIHGHTPTVRYISSGQCIDCIYATQAKVSKEKRAQYRSKKSKTYPSKAAVITNTLEAQAEYLQSINMPSAKEQIDLINKALAHKSGAKWVI